MPADTPPNAMMLGLADVELEGVAVREASGDGVPCTLEVNVGAAAAEGVVLLTPLSVGMGAPVRDISELAEGEGLGSGEELGLREEMEREAEGEEVGEGVGGGGAVAERLGVREARGEPLPREEALTDRDTAGDLEVEGDALEEREVEKLTEGVRELLCDGEEERDFAGDGEAELLRVGLVEAEREVLPQSD